MNSAVVYFPVVPGVRFAFAPGFSRHCIGDDGSVWSSLRTSGRKYMYPWRKLHGCRVDKWGRIRVLILGDDDKYHSIFVHRLVLEAFVGPCPDGMECCHDPDYNPSNNRLENLRWDTRKANMEDAKRHGRREGCNLPGEQNGHAKLTEQQVIEIRRLASLGVKPKVIGEQFVVKRGVVYGIIGRRTWKHLPVESAP